MVVMQTTLAIALSAAFVLGVEHAFEPDHVIAVSTMATQSKGIGRSLLCLASHVQPRVEKTILRGTLSRVPLSQPSTQE